MRDLRAEKEDYRRPSFGILYCCNFLVLANKASSGTLETLGQ